MLTWGRGSQSAGLSGSLPVRDLKWKLTALIKKLRKTCAPCFIKFGKVTEVLTSIVAWGSVCSGSQDRKKEAPPCKKPEPVRTHLQNMIIVPQMAGSTIGLYNDKTFNQKPIVIIFSRISLNGGNRSSRRNTEKT